MFKSYIKIIGILSTISLSFSCSSQNVGVTSAMAKPEMAGAPAPSSAPYGYDSALNNFKPGVLPDTALSPEEAKLASLLSKKVKIEFPVKLGLVLYKPSSAISEKDRVDYYNNFVSELKKNPNVSSVSEISSSLVSSANSVEDLRKLAARFQVSILLIVNDTYQPAIEDKTALKLPVDVVLGNKNWESFSNIEVFALDILSGVFISSESASSRISEKYTNEEQDKQANLIKRTSANVWKDITTKVLKKLDEVKIQQPAEAPAPSASTK